MYVSTQTPFFFLIAEFSCGRFYFRNKKGSKSRNTEVNKMTKRDYNNGCIKSRIKRDARKF